MSDEIVQQKVHITVDGKVVTKNVLDLSPEQYGEIRRAEDIFRTVKQGRLTEEEMQTVREAVDAGGHAADDVMSYTLISNRLNRQAREQAEEEQRARAADAKAAERDAQIQAAREEYLRPSNRAEVARQSKNQNLPDQPAAPPAREYTDAEQDAMSSEDMVRLGIVSRGSRIEDKQGSSGPVFRPERSPERTAEYRKRKDLMKPLAEILGQKPHSRKIKFSAEELAAREYRKGVVAQNESERRKLKEDLERVREEQEEKRHNAKKQRRS